MDDSSLLHRSAYPKDLVAQARARWRRMRERSDMVSCALREASLLTSPSFEALVSIAYQASLLQEESRPVTFRLLVSEIACLPIDDGPPHGLLRLPFDHPRPYTEHELRRLSPAAKYHRSLIGVRQTYDSEFAIWGILQSGPRWLQAARGGRTAPSPVPRDALILRVTGPGRISVGWGDLTLAQLRGGEIVEGSMDVFESAWLPGRFSSIRGELFALHEAAAERSPKARVPLDRNLTGIIAQQMVKRLVAVMRAAHHGGTVVLVPSESLGELTASTGPLRLKYRFADDEARRRYRKLILATLDVLSETAAELSPTPSIADWKLYQQSQTPALSALDEAIFEMSHLIAALADVDGVVLMTHRFELIGFGGEIAGVLPEIDSVRRARDLEALTYELESIDGMGTRHRSAYRLCAHVRDATAIVVSQDGSARFVAHYNGEITYWDHVSADGADV